MEEQTEMEVQCPYCASKLSLHQPDALTTDRLLGTCDKCHAWFLVDVICAGIVTTEIASRGPVTI
jgi:hypothetical protein